MKSLRLALLALILGTVSSAIAQAPGQQPRPKGPTLYQRLLSSTVSVSVSGRDGQETVSGSGVILSADGLVLTNYHVVEGGVFFDVRLAGPRGPIRVPARPSKCAADFDLALLQIAPQAIRLRPVRIGAAVPRIGDRVLALGAPLALDGTLTDGIVSQVRQLGERTLIQTTAPISPGSSGGGLFLTDGQLVGITTLTLKGGQGLNFAVSSLDFPRLVPCSSFPSVSDSGLEESESSPAATPAPTPCPAKLVITEAAANPRTSARTVAALGVVHAWMEGVISNQGCSGARFVKVVIEARTPDGEFITTNWGYVSPDRIGPGESSSFKIPMEFSVGVYEKYGAAPKCTARISEGWLPD